MAVDGLTTQLGDGAALSVDFVNRFGRRFDALRNVLGITRTLPLPAGSTFTTYGSAEVTLATTPEKGAEIPLSEVVLGDPTVHTIAWQKHRKAVALEDIHAYGFVRAINRTDEALIRQLQAEVKSNLMNGLFSGTGTAEGENLQQAMAQALANLQVVFDGEEIQAVTWINPFDVADYTGNADVTMQTDNGLTYLNNFLGNYRAIVDPAVPQGTIYSTLSDNLVAVHADMNAGELARAGFDFTLDETGLIGVTHDINKSHARAETITVSGVHIFAERADGIIATTIEPPAAGAGD